MRYNTAASTMPIHKNADTLGSGTGASETLTLSNADPKAPFGGLRLEKVRVEVGAVAVKKKEWCW